jgi:hypothetical protein
MSIDNTDPFFVAGEPAAVKSNHSRIIEIILSILRVGLLS